MGRLGFSMALAVLTIAIGGCSAKDKTPETQNPGGGTTGTDSPAMTAGNGAPAGGETSAGGGNATPSGEGGRNEPTSMAGTGGPTSGSGGSEDTTPPPIEELPPCDSWDELALLFSASPSCMSSTNMTETAIADCSKGYSAYDGEHVFQIQAQVDGLTVELEDWHAVPAEAVIFDPDPVTGGVLITVQQGVPEITIAVCTGGTVGGTAPLYITEATPAEWAIGEARYYNDVVYEWPPLSWELLIDPNYMVPEPPDNLACDNCHTSGAPALAIEHTPSQIGYISDEHLTTIFETGMKPPGVGWSLIPPAFQRLYVGWHAWNAGADAQKALIVFLRSFTPKEQGPMGPVPGLGPPPMP
jgi:hypothetical protein